MCPANLLKDLDGFGIQLELSAVRAHLQQTLISRAKREHIKQYRWASTAHNKRKWKIIINIEWHSDLHRRTMKIQTCLTLLLCNSLRPARNVRWPRTTSQPSYRDIQQHFWKMTHKMASNRCLKANGTFSISTSSDS